MADTNETSLSLLDRLTNDPESNDWLRMLAIYRPLMLKKIASYPLLTEQAEDIVQETLVVLMQELPSFQRQRTGSFRAFLREILINQLRYALRRIRREPSLALRINQLQDQIEELADPNSDSTSRFDLEHDQAVFQYATERVSKRVHAVNWQAFLRHAVAGEEASVVAKDLGISLNVVLLAKSRITRRIREEIHGMVD